MIFNIIETMKVYQLSQTFLDVRWLKHFFINFTTKISFIFILMATSLPAVDIYYTQKNCFLWLLFLYLLFSIIRYKSNTCNGLHILIICLQLFLAKRYKFWYFLVLWPPPCHEHIMLQLLYDIKLQKLTLIITLIILFYAFISSFISANVKIR